MAELKIENLTISIEFANLVRTYLETASQSGGDLGFRCSHETCRRTVVPYPDGERGSSVRAPLKPMPQPRGSAIALNFFLGLFYAWEAMSYVILANVPLLSFSAGFTLIRVLAPWLAVIALSWKPRAIELR